MTPPCAIRWPGASRALIPLAVALPLLLENLEAELANEKLELAEEQLLRWRAGLIRWLAPPLVI